MVSNTAEFLLAAVSEGADPEIATYALAGPVAARASGGQADCRMDQVGEGFWSRYAMTSIGVLCPWGREADGPRAPQVLGCAARAVECDVRRYGAAVIRAQDM